MVSQQNSLEQLELAGENLQLYCAGLPGFPRNFTRDSIISAILMQNEVMLRDQLIFCAQKQGQKKDSYTGEEPGKIFHEFPGVEIRKKSTLYDACDTTALFIIGHKVYQDLSNDRMFLHQHQHAILRAAEYIQSHIKNGLFIEDPTLSSAKTFALKVTYWKDSEIPHRTNGCPIYPVSYFLSHVQNMHALRCVHHLFEDSKSKKLFLEMKHSLPKFFDLKTSATYIAIDAKGPIAATSSDFLHSLMYLDPTDLDPTFLKLILKQAKKLETTNGYLSLSSQEDRHVADKYHAEIVWPFEQAIIHIGATKFKLTNIQKISLRTFDFLKTEPELLTKKGVAKGNDPQLWTLAAKEYFSRNSP